MPRNYICPHCERPATTSATRGPLPIRCPDCLAAHGQPTRAERARTELARAAPIETPTRQQTVEQIVYSDKAELALTMRIDYASWREIAETCNYSSERTAFIAVRQLMQKRQTALGESIDHVRIRELERLERMSAAAQKVLDTAHYLVSAGKVVTDEDETGRAQKLLDDGPVLAALDRLVKISESRRKLLGLDAAEKVRNDVHVKYTVEGIGESEMP